jgi:hypothetical protein
MLLIYFHELALICLICAYFLLMQINVSVFLCACCFFNILKVAVKSATHKTRPASFIPPSKVYSIICSPSEEENIIDDLATWTFHDNTLIDNNQ